MRGFPALLVGLLGLGTTLSVAVGMTLLAYWGMTTPAFADCTSAGKTFVHESATYARSSDASEQTFNLDDTTKAVNVRIQVKTRSFLPLNIGGASGSISWVLRDPTGTSVWRDSTSDPTFDIAKQFDRKPGQWILTYSLDQHSGGYAICAIPVK